MPLAGCCSSLALSSDAASSPWFHCEPPLLFSRVLEELNFELTLEQGRKRSSPWSVWGLDLNLGILSRQPIL